MMGPQTDAFDEEVQHLHDKRHQAEHDSTDYDKEFASFPHEASAHKMRQAQMGLAPSPMEQAQVKQQGALGQQAATQGAIQAQQAQGGQTPIQPPQAPTGPVGTTAPYPAQAGEEKESPSEAPPAAPGAPEGP
jgi:hypothetical protein